MVEVCHGSPAPLPVNNHLAHALAPVHEAEPLAVIHPLDPRGQLALLGLPTQRL